MQGAPSVSCAGDVVFDGLLSIARIEVTALPTGARFPAILERNLPLEWSGVAWFFQTIAIRCAVIGVSAEFAISAASTHHIMRGA
jgi:hypothetical protein